MSGGGDPRKAIASAAAVWAASLAGLAVFAHGPWRVGLVAGALAAGLGAAAGFALLVPARGRDTARLLRAVVIGLLARMVLVGAGLAAVVKVWRGEPLGFALAFFPLFFGLMYFEVRAATGAPRSGSEVG